MKSKFIILLSTFVFFFASCDKEEDLTIKQMISGKEWIVSTMTIDPPINLGNGDISDLLSLIDECEYDNTYTFNENGSFVLDEGLNKCIEDEPQTIAGTWILDEEGTLLTIFITYEEITEKHEYELLEVTTEKIAGKMKVEINGFPLTPNITFIRK